jgi:DNA (cytosine-5)-methyltransferase 1
VLADLEGEAYTCQPFIIPACAVDAPHRRDRVWIVAYSEHDGRVDLEITEGPGSRIDPSERTVGAEQSARSDRCTGGTANVADAAGDGRKQRRAASEQSRQAGWPVIGGASLADPLKPGLEGHSRHGAYRRESRRVETHAQRSACPPGISGRGAKFCAFTWDPEPLVGRLAHGVPDRVVRLRALGNAVVPQVVTVLGKMILSADESTQ